MRDLNKIAKQLSAITFIQYRYPDKYCEPFSKIQNDDSKMRAFLQEYTMFRIFMLDSTMFEYYHNDYENAEYIKLSSLVLDNYVAEFIAGLQDENLADIDHDVLNERMAYYATHFNLSSEQSVRQICAMILKNAGMQHEKDFDIKEYISFQAKHFLPEAYHFHDAIFETISGNAVSSDYTRTEQEDNEFDEDASNTSAGGTSLIWTVVLGLIFAFALHSMSNSTAAYLIIAVLMSGVFGYQNAVAKTYLKSLIPCVALVLLAYEFYQTGFFLFSLGGAIGMSRPIPRPGEDTNNIPDTARGHMFVAFTIIGPLLMLLGIGWMIKDAIM